MKFYKTVSGLVNYITKNANTGRERTVNGVLMFGIGIYAYADVCTYYGIHGEEGKNNVYRHLSHVELCKFIAKLQQQDGYLMIE